MLAGLWDFWVPSLGLLILGCRSRARVVFHARRQTDVRVCLQSTLVRSNLNLIGLLPPGAPRSIQAANGTEWCASRSHFG